MKCSFCGKLKKEVQALVVARNGGATICNRCVSSAVTSLLTKLRAQPIGGVSVVVDPPLPIGDADGH